VACNVISRFDFLLEAANRERGLSLSICFFARFNKSTDWNLWAKIIKCLISPLGGLVREDFSSDYLCFCTGILSKHASQLSLLAMISKPIRVLVVIPSLGGGGAERVIVTLLRHFNYSMFHVTLVVVNTGHSHLLADIPATVDICDLGCTRVRYALWKIFRLIWKSKPNIVLSTVCHMNLALAVLRPLLPNRPSYIARETIIVSELSASYRVPIWWNWVYKHVYNRLDAVICQSKDMQSDLVNLYGVPPNKTIVIANPVDIWRIRDLAKERPAAIALETIGNSRFILLVAAGRLVHQKGFDLLIRAIALCGDRRLRLLLLGEGDLRTELHELAVACGVSDQIIFMGFQENPYPYFSIADGFVLSSRFEGFPNVVIEALTCGTPVIATPAPGGVREIINGLKGTVLADSISSEALAKALAVFTVGNRMPHDVVTDYSVHLIARRYEQVFLDFSN
jgi:glycosyltransferase involved in cell wall biosynthesis